MNKENLKKFLSDKLNDTPWLSFLIRDRLERYWIRLHSFSNAQRYPKNNDELKQVIDHQNNILKEVFEENSEIFIIILDFSDEKEMPKLEIEDISSYEIINNIETEKLDKRDNFYVVKYINQAVRSVNWKIGSINNILKSVINDEIDNVFLVNIKSDVIVSPYDGGIDLYIFDDSKRNFVRKEFNEFYYK